MRVARLGTTAALAILLAANVRAATCLHRDSAFDMEIGAPYERVAGLFGAERERDWAGPEWDPHFVFPLRPADTSGAVFTIQHGDLKMLWIVSRFDLKARHIQYISVVAGAMVTQLDITFPAGPAAHTRVHVAYARTALDPAFNAHIEQLAAQDLAKSQEWQQAIERYLGARAPSR